MSKLKLSDFASIAEILASVVVIASLAYIGLELRQNTQAMQQASYQSANDYLLQLDLAQATDEELNRLVMKAESTPADVTEEEWKDSRKWHTVDTGCGSSLSWRIKKMPSIPRSCWYSSPILSSLPATPDTCSSGRTITSGSLQYFNDTLRRRYCRSARNSSAILRQSPSASGRKRLLTIPEIQRFERPPLGKADIPPRFPPGHLHHFRPIYGHEVHPMRHGRSPGSELHRS